MLKTSFQEVIFSVIDLETTGYLPERNSIIEVGVQQIENLKMSKTFHTLICPEEKIPLSVTEITGINNDMVMEQPYIEEIETDLVNFIDTTILVEHSKRDFDLRFLKNNLTSLGKVFHLNTILLLTKLFPDIKKYSLRNAALYLGIGLYSDHTYHNALEDAHICAEIFLRIIQELSYRSITCLNDIATIFNIRIIK